MSRRKLFSLANESISFQSDRFGKELQLAIDVYIDKNDEVILYKNLSESIKSHTGINVTVRCRKGGIEHFLYSLPAVSESKDFIIGHVINNDFFKDHIEFGLLEMTKSEIDKAQREFKENLDSIVDLKTAKVSGIFTKRECEIIFEPEPFKKKGFTTSEMTAIILHEIGHIFTMYEYANRLSKTNQALTFISRLLMDKAPVEKLVYNFELIGDKLVNDDKAFIGLEKVTDNTVISTVIIDKIREHAKSELGFRDYDLTTSEYLADQFASRQGYGKDLATALHKIHKLAEYDEVNPYSCMTQEILGMIALSLLPIAVGLVPGFAASIVISALNIYYSGHDMKDYTYDNARTRLLRIKEQAIEQLKVKKLNDKIAKQVLDDIKFIDKCLSETKGFESLWTKINTFFSKKNKNIIDMIQLQRDLEELSSNDLFIKSAKLKLI